VVVVDFVVVVVLPVLLLVVVVIVVVVVDFDVVEVVEPPPDPDPTVKLPVNLISLLEAPTYTENVPLGTTHFCCPTSQ